MPEAVFQFKQFSVRHDRCAVKVGTDGVLLGAWTDYSRARRILDIGTGSGVLALIAAQRNATATIDAVEIDDAAAEQAAGNFSASPWSDRLRAHRMDVRRMKASEPYDLIICNPPFYAGEMDSPDDRKGLAKHSGELGFQDLLAAMDRLRAPDGACSLILPLNREKEFVTEAERLGFFPSRRCLVRYLKARPAKRVLLELGRAKGDVREEEIAVEIEAGGGYSPEYRALLSDLMLRF